MPRTAAVIKVVLNVRLIMRSSSFECLAVLLFNGRWMETLNQGERPRLRFLVTTSINSVGSDACRTFYDLKGWVTLSVAWDDVFLLGLSFLALFLVSSGTVWKEGASSSSSSRLLCSYREVGQVTASYCP
jgi:hypothetical protein